MKLTQKFQVLLAMTRLQKQWLNVSFSHYGSLYYAGDVQSPTGTHYVRDGRAVKDFGFAIRPTTGRDWVDGGISVLDIERGPWPSVTEYLQAVGSREAKAMKHLIPPKQIALFCGPRLYQPDIRKKRTALARYQQIVDDLIPKDTRITNPYLWHHDLHSDNIYRDPDNPENITGIVDWQSCHISPLFNHNPDPAFLEGDGFEPETLDLIPRPNLSGLSPEQRSAAVREYSFLNTFLGWRKLMHAKNPDMHQRFNFERSRHTWTDLPVVTSDRPFPFNFSEEDLACIEWDSDGAVAGTELVAKVKESLGDLWTDKGFIERERYDDCRDALQEVKAQVLEQLAETDEEKAEYLHYWPFDWLLACF
ncbi:hypothetical protein LOZ53_004523 [Ophidiomyces ophidiicola]|nr:hypothetical protein LOZ54_006216 [Ophidiomyces ophidiicola]KAI1978996.1 hypothetical protein LOZ55_002288 [Ophidiomyces ophidiicola]KAI1986950.1 hypothetical protein LOZ53_004523 [Ophidiomyces ophidiicola]KAI2001215.1 hypothetical protein LOZ51_001507 [Ophidiomyces ophidiicola]